MPKPADITAPQSAQDLRLISENLSGRTLNEVGRPGHMHDTPLRPDESVIEILNRHNQNL
ncbi:hypothetical protein SAMN05421811_12179 [Nonomuraea wenchangensis]|uniref:Uncharacterized protein n=1 Tax=Nonomuraea wenchangensis TaxID=568860 RepID=A0A1I0LNX4_9ACTN|nr:hypothetical protein SAMN05421811_12179 [Nonomuraea wenchangensis]